MYSRKREARTAQQCYADVVWYHLLDDLELWLMTHFLKYDIAITQYSQTEGRIARYASPLGTYEESTRLLNYYYYLLHYYGFCQYLLICIRTQGGCPDANTKPEITMEPLPGY